MGAQVSLMGVRRLSLCTLVCWLHAIIATTTTKRLNEIHKTGFHCNFIMFTAAGGGDCHLCLLRFFFHYSLTLD